MKYFVYFVIIAGLVIVLVETKPDKKDPVVEVQKIMVKVDLDSCNFVDECKGVFETCNMTIDKSDLVDCFKSIYKIRKGQ